jgi:hypothetical protein
MLTLVGDNFGFLTGARMLLFEQVFSLCRKLDTNLISPPFLKSILLPKQ